MINLLKFMVDRMSYTSEKCFGNIKKYRLTNRRANNKIMEIYNSSKHVDWEY